MTAQLFFFLFYYYHINPSPNIPVKKELLPAPTPQFCNYVLCTWTHTYLWLKTRHHPCLSLVKFPNGLPQTWGRPPASVSTDGHSLPPCSNPTELLVPTHSNCYESLQGPFCPEHARLGLGANMKVRAASPGRSLTCHGTSPVARCGCCDRSPPPPCAALHFPRSLPASEGTRASQRPVASLWEKVPARRMFSLFRALAPLIPHPSCPLSQQSGEWPVLPEVPTRSLPSWLLS